MPAEQAHRFDPDKTCYLIDASVPFFKYYFTLPDNWTSEDGFPTATVFGFTRWTLKFLRETRPQHVVACFDESLGSCFRNDLYPDYKSSRPPADDVIRYQFEACKAMLKSLGIACYASNRYEADDLIGTIADKNRKQKLNNVFVTKDKDLMQLLEGRDRFWDFPDKAPIGVAGVEEKLGVPPHLVADWLALMGDAIDDIPGVPGIGKITAAKLLRLFGSLEQVLFALTEADPKHEKMLKKLVGYEDQIRLSYQLALVHRQAKLGRALRTKRGKTHVRTFTDHMQYLGLNIRLPEDLA